jgi:signal transduction histidine kinase
VKNIFRNNLFIKICLSFWMTTLFMIGSVLTVDWLTETGPFYSPQHPIHGSPLAVHGQAMAWILEHEGVSSLNVFADRLRKETGLWADFFDKNGMALTGPSKASDMEALATTAMQVGGTGQVLILKGGKVALGIVGPSGERYAIVAEVPPRPPPPENNDPWMMILIRLLVVLTVSGLICYLLARYLTSPILKLGDAARQMAAGDLSARIGQSLGKRRDEISWLALDFDHMAERVESLLNSQRMLLRDISHELRSPLARLNVALELCRKESGPDNGKALDRIEKESVKINDMIGHLLTLNRVESGIFAAERTTIDLEKLIHECVADADFEAGSLNRKVKITVTETCFVEGNEDLLCRAIDNVLRNAVRYTADETTVEVSLCSLTNRENFCCLVKIRDYGNGVPEESLPHLFQPFYRVGEARERETGGTGLGLAITEAAVRLHGGTVHASNADGRGLIIEISIPALFNRNGNRSPRLSPGDKR